MAFAIRSKKTHRVYNGYSWNKLTEDYEPCWSLNPDDYSNAELFQSKEGAQVMLDNYILGYCAKDTSEIVEVKQ